jgi:hypothetical protein
MLRRFYFWGWLPFDEEGIGLAFIADGGEFAMAGHDYSFIGQGQQRVVQRVQYFLHRSAREISAADGPGEEGVAGDEFFLGREVEADAAFGVAGSMEDVGGERTGSNGFAGRNAAVDFNFAWIAHADPCGLRVEHFQKSVVVLVEQDGSAGGGAEFHGSADVVDVGVGDDDLFDLQVVFAKQGLDVFDIIAGVDDHGFVSGLVADDGAVALQRADGEDFVDHSTIVTSCAQHNASTTKDTKTQ